VATSVLGEGLIHRVGWDQGIDHRHPQLSFIVRGLLARSLLVNVDTPFARFAKCDFPNPGTFHWTSPTSLTPMEPHCSGKVVILVDERSISQAEYTAMAFRAAHGAIVAGSSTAGAEGDVSSIPLPGGLRRKSLPSKYSAGGEVR
jgi:Peptidase family S41